MPLLFRYFINIGTDRLIDCILSFSVAYRINPVSADIISLNASTNAMYCFTLSTGQIGTRMGKNTRDKNDA